MYCTNFKGARRDLLLLGAAARPASSAGHRALRGRARLPLGAHAAGDARVSTERSHRGPREPLRAHEQSAEHAVEALPLPAAALHQAARYAASARRRRRREAAGRCTRPPLCRHQTTAAATATASASASAHRKQQ